jgi:hypothetical protein
MYTWKVSWNLIPFEKDDDFGHSRELSLLKLVHAREIPSQCFLHEAL